MAKWPLKWLADVAQLPGYGEATPDTVDAILEGHGDQALVFVVDPATGAARRTRIATGRLWGDMVAVTSGVTEGDQVVIDGAGYLSDGEQVLISTASMD